MRPGAGAGASGYMYLPTPYVHTPCSVLTEQRYGGPCLSVYLYGLLHCKWTCCPCLLATLPTASAQCSAQVASLAARLQLQVQVQVPVHVHVHVCVRADMLYVRAGPGLSRGQGNKVASLAGAICARSTPCPTGGGKARWRNERPRPALLLLSWLPAHAIASCGAPSSVTVQRRPSIGRRSALFIYLPVLFVSAAVHCPPSRR